MAWNSSHGKALVVVHWLDAHGSSTQAYTEENLQHKAFPMDSYGLLLRSDEEGVSIATETYFDDIDQIQTYRGHTFIPRGMVVSVEVLKAAKKSKVKPQAAPPSPEPQTDPL